jgi:SAM-dependent methyltransferase
MDIWIVILLLIVLLALIIPITYARHAVRKFSGSAEYESRKVVIHNASVPGSISYSDFLSGKQEHHIRSYKNWNSNTQIQHIARYAPAAVFADLCKLLLKRVPGKQRLRTINMMYNQTDDQIYKHIGGFMQRNNVERAEGQATELCRAIHRFLYSESEMKNPTFKTYLDIGCGDGSITKLLAECIGAEQVHCVEVKSPPADTTIKYSQPADTGLLEYDDNHFDMITAIMCLHHVKNLDTMVSEIHRILKPGGYLFIKEHDCWTEYDAMLVDIEHCMYINALESQSTVNMDGVVEHYKNFNGWDAALAPLQYITSDYYYTSVRNAISPTRAFIALYKKV